jgi:hypothetical protein
MPKSFAVSAVSFALLAALWGNGAMAQSQDVSAKEAFEAARELGTAEAWDAFLASYPRGFYANLARAYIKKLGAAAPGDNAAAKPEPEQNSTAKTEPAPSADTAAALPPTEPGKPGVARGGQYMGFAEQFNRYYTDPDWKPSRTVYVSPNGNGDGAGPDTPMAVQAAVADARPGTLIHFLRGSYSGCFELSKENSGTYDDPVVLYAERNDDKSIGVKMSCCTSGRQTCFNLEGADYIAVDGFELIGGRYGVRAIGEG